MTHAQGILKIDLQALQDNYNYFCEEVSPACEVAGVVKADAYGLGMEPVARALSDVGCQTYFVALLDEGLDLRRILPDVDIFIFNGLSTGDEAQYSAHGLIPILNSLEEITRYQAFAKSRNERLLAAIHFDTGMNRLGLSAQETRELLSAPEMLEGLEIVHVMSHFASADEVGNELMHQQYEDFKEIAAQFPGAKKSLSNSPGIFRRRDYDFDMVRPGISMYGGNPTPETDNPMNAVAALEVPVLQLRQALKGETIGYGETYRFEIDATLATLSIGYADGFLRSLSGSGQLYWNGQVCPIRGRVSMDLTSIDLSDVPEDERPKPGDMIEVIGPNQSIDDLADAAGTISYEILTSLGQRYAREYLNMPQTQKKSASA